MWPLMQTFTMNRECNEHHVMEKIKKNILDLYLPNLIPRSAITNVSLSREAPEILGVSFTIHENVLISPLTSASMIACWSPWQKNECFVASFLYNLLNVFYRLSFGHVHFDYAAVFRLFMFHQSWKEPRLCQIFSGLDITSLTNLKNELLAFTSLDIKMKPQMFSCRC